MGGFSATRSQKGLPGLDQVASLQNFLELVNKYNPIVPVVANVKYS